MATNTQRTTSDHRTDETKPALRTTELVLYVAAVMAVAVTAFVVDGGNGDGDPFGADQALRYITFLTIGYMIARGLAKSGSRDSHHDGR